MITHLVFFRLQDEHKDKATILRDKLMALPDKIPVIQHYEVGINIIEAERNYDISLISRFDSMQDLKTYTDDPHHQEVVAYIKSVISDSKAVDYES